MVRLLFSVAISVMGCLFTEIGVASEAQRFDQMAFVFTSKRDYTYEYLESANALVLHIQGTTPGELDALDRYDDRLIRRVLVRDLGGQGVEVKIFLRDRKVRATVSSFEEPFRIILDLFDSSYREARDPATGLPLVTTAGNANGEVTQQEQPASDFSGALVAPAPAPGENPDPTNDSGRMRLVQPQRESGDEQLAGMAGIGKVAAGPGKAWQDFPVYIYRLQTTPYKTGKDYQQWVKNQNLKALTSGEALADYAGKLFDFGHEGRALVAYQQVLHKAPVIFSKEPLHLWKLAEIHMGQGNLTLADGYYQSEIEKHPDSPLAKFAQLRRLDIKALRALERNQTSVFGKLASELEGINAGSHPELQAQIAIRRAYWAPKDGKELQKVAADRYYLPALDANTAVLLEGTYKNVESNWTAFLASSLILNDALEAKKPWQAKTTELASVYFKQYKGPKVEPITSTLEEKMRNVLNGLIREHVSAKRYVEAVQVYETLPRDLRPISDNPDTARAMGEAYRHLNQPEKAAHYYQKASQRDDGTLQFEALFWLAMMAGDAGDLTQGNKALAVKFRKVMSTADNAMWESWQRLKDAERKQVLTELRPDLEQAVASNHMLQSPARVVLGAWSAALSSEISTPASGPADGNAGFSPSANTIRLLSDLGNKFKKLGMRAERQESMRLLARLKPSQFDKDKGAMEVWAEQLSNFAEELRQDNEYLESGRTYALVGGERSDWEGRAEALYKGGLLLYRAGRRDEAVEAFKKASEDGNNLMYADLAKARLSQLQQ